MKLENNPTRGLEKQKLINLLSNALENALRTISQRFSEIFTNEETLSQRTGKKTETHLEKSLNKERQRLLHNVVCEETRKEIDTLLPDVITDTSSIDRIQKFLQKKIQETRHLDPLASSINESFDKAFAEARKIIQELSEIPTDQSPIRKSHNYDYEKFINQLREVCLEALKVDQINDIEMYLLELEVVLEDLLEDLVKSNGSHTFNDIREKLGESIDLSKATITDVLAANERTAAIELEDFQKRKEKLVEAAE